MPTYTVNDQEIHTVEEGLPNRQKAILIHGWSSSSYAMSPLAGLLSQRFSCVAVDLPGYGRSPPLPERTTIPAYADLLVNFIERISDGPVVLLGHSMGGPVVVEAARLLGDRVKLIVGVDTFNDVEARYSEEEIEAVSATFRTDFSATTREWARSQAFLPTSDSALVEQVADDMSSAPAAVASGAIEGMFRWSNDESAAALRDVRVPIVLINSDYRPTNVDLGREYVSSFDVVLMSGVGHFVMMEDPETFNRLLGEIVEGLQED